MKKVLICQSLLLLCLGMTQLSLAATGRCAEHILTPAPSPAPQINGAKVFGVRPSKPMLYTIAASGQRPMTFSTKNLPDGLTLDAQTGRITGRVAKPLTYQVILRAKNELGQDESVLRIVVGKRIALTPPMGCNTWNSWGSSITDEIVRKSAQAFVDKGLVNYRHIWMKDMEDGSKAVGLFNLSDVVTTSGLWRQKDIGIWEGSYKTKVNPHGVVFLQLFPEK